MLNIRRWAALVLCLGMICACSAPDKPSQTEHAPKPADTPIVHEQTGALKKAQDLSQRLQKKRDAQQKQVEEGTR